MPKKLKDLSQGDLDEISEFVSSAAQNFILKHISKKEILDLDIKVEISYEEVLDVDLMIDLDLDELSTQDPDIVNEAVIFAHEELDKFLDENFRI